MSRRLKQGGPCALLTAPNLDGTPFLDLANGWALSADRNQWILNKAKKLRGKVKWQPRAFVGSNSTVLRRVMREKGLPLGPDANDALNQFFGGNYVRFIDWREEVTSGKRGRAA